MSRVLKKGPIFVQVAVAAVSFRVDFDCSWLVNLPHPNFPPPRNKALIYKGLLINGFPKKRPAIKPIFLRRVYVWVGLVD